ncbi:cobalt-zinc-cadmium resistance protein [Paucibacter sp. R3-3]|uniref:Cobalt-zinc-cadmium resistance protein n=1 Tax=Roseateles agri TaxID=3098619 RepID=A0ABU5DJM3_9BURK|nr:cation efflux protein, CzcI family [Paucibacter sp. R3-3]MDY0745996.1 cobalt-zinc-cadmium resistance protein [Paucibacter sp. R3-3]
MKRLFVLLVALLLPFQLAWGVAATYCQHETTPQQARHFGHHTHVHTEAKPDGGKTAGKLAGAKLAADFDCGFCHASPAAALPAFEALPEAPATAVPPLALGDLRPPSAPQRAPDRPQWPRLA